MGAYYDDSKPFFFKAQDPGVPPQSTPAPVPEPAPQLQPQPQPKQEVFTPKRPKMAIHIKPKLFILIAAVIIIAVVAVVLVMTAKPSPKTTTTTTIMQNINVSAVNSCRQINSSGTYFVQSSIHTSQASGPCINISASNVKLVCNQNSITGSGPYLDTPPFTYGVQISNAMNVSVESCQINGFSFGILERNSTRSSIINDNVSQNFISNIRLENSSYNRISNNYLSKTASASGSVSLTNNSEKNILLNNVAQFDAEFGFVIGSKNNTFINNSFRGTPVSFYCIGDNGFVHNNLASSNRCYNNTGCNFVSCIGSNIQTNVDSVTLTPAISTCGSITSPGVYKLTNNISMSYFIDTAHATTPCISVRSNYVTLDCNGHTISNATTAIQVSNVINADIVNCRIKDSVDGITLDHVSNSNVTNANIYNNTNAALLIQNSNTDTISNLTAYGNRYGIFMFKTLASLANRFSITNNTFGIYVSGSLGNSFTNGRSLNNTRVDMYATEDSANSTSDIMQKTTCGLSDAEWANCLQYISPTLQYYPIYSCGTLSRAGTYKLLSNIVGVGSTCFNIKQNDIILDCSNYKLISAQQTGPAVNITGRTNVTIENCSITGFGPAISINRSTEVNIINNKLNSSASGIVAANSRSLNLIENNISVFNTYGLSLLNTTQSNVLLNKVNRNPKNNIGIFLNDSQYNNILNNTVTSTTGMYIAGHSNNNTISDNFVQSGSTDYICSKGNSPINAEYGGINYGTNKQGCLWLAAVLKSSPNVACTSTINPTIYSLTNDYVYNTGATCFNIYSNNTLINCNGHTIIATNGGTFINFIKSQNSNMQNCNLKGFSSPIKASYSSVTIQNNTIYVNSSMPINTAAINITSSKSLDMEDNKIIAPYYGMVLGNVSSGTIANNNVTSYITAYSFTNVNGTNINNNLAPYYGTYGMLLSNSVQDSLRYNDFNGVYGLYCKGSSIGAKAELDMGNNACSSSTACGWLGSSLAICQNKQ